jgi:hypothetical protein
MATTKRKTVRRSSSRKTVESKSSQAATIMVGLMMLAIVALVLIALSDHGVRVQSPVYVAKATQIVAQSPADEAPVVVSDAPQAEDAPIEAHAQPVANLDQDRVARLIKLDAVYRSSGWQEWLKVAGITCDASVEARQPEEETVVDANGTVHVVVSGIQVKGNCTIPWPAVVTTDRPNEVETSADSRTYQPDLKNPSVMYTNAKLKGQGTIWVDSSNWGQLDPTK